MPSSLPLARWTRFLMAACVAASALGVQAAIQSQTRPTATGVTAGGTWTNATNALSINSQCALGDGVSSSSLTLTNFGFSIPGAATILGVTVQSVSSFNDASTQEQMQLVKAMVAVGTARILNGPGTVSVPSCGNPVGGSQGLTVGGASDLWGTTLIPGDVNATTFGVLYDNDFRNTAVDGVSITVTYQDNVMYTVTPSAGLHGSISPSTPQSVLSGTTTAFTVTPSLGYAASVGGTCGGNLVGTTYTTDTISAACTVAATFTPIPEVATDLNFDGKSDIIYRNTSTGQVFRLLMSGLTVSNGAMAYTEPNTAWKIVGDGDFGGDGIADLLWRNDSTGAVYYMPFGATGLPSGGAIVMTEPNAAWKIVHTPDLDGDGASDILWWNSSTGQVFAMLMNGASIVTQGFVYTEPNTAWKIVAVGDFAGSGKRNQLLWRNSATGQVFLMTVTVSAGVFSQTGEMIYTEANTAWKIVGAADFSGDGKSDILWRNDSNGVVWMMIMNGGSISTQGSVHVEPNSAWKIVAFGDYDGNSRADLLWRNESTGQVWMMLLNGLSISSQGLAYTEGNTAWKVLGPWEYGQASGILP